MAYVTNLYEGGHVVSIESRFIRLQPDIRPVPGGSHEYKLMEPVPFRVNGISFEIEEGFTYDGASAPGVAALIGIYPDGLNRMASLFHDKGYRERGFGILKRKHVDKLFYRMMILSGYPRWKARVKYGFVKTLGLPYWLSDDKGSPLLSRGGAGLGSGG